MKLTARLLLAMGCICLFLGCSAKKRVAPLSPTYLEDADLSQRIENLPFDHSAIRSDAPKGRFTAIYVEPIRTDLIPAEEWKRSSSSAIASKETFDREAQILAEYFRSQLEKALRADASGKWAVVSKSGPGVLDLKIVLTELEFSHPAARAASLIAPVPGSGAVISSVSDPHVAFAARIFDGGSGKLLATFADRKFAPTRILDFNKLTATSSAREICALWAISISEAIASGGLSEVKEKKFDWKLW